VKVLSLINGQFDVPGRITKRLGYLSTNYAAPYMADAVFDYVGQALAHSRSVTGKYPYSLSSYSSTSGAWVPHGTMAMVEPTIENIVSNDYTQTNPDVARNGNIQCVVWEDTAGGVWYQIKELTTHSVLVNAQVSSIGTCPRVLAISSAFIIFYIKTVGGHRSIYAAPISTTNPTVLGTAVRIIAADNASDISADIYDVCTDFAGTTAYVAWITSTGLFATYITVAPSMIIHAKIALPETTPDGVGAITCFTVMTGDVFVAWWDSTTHHVYLDVGNAALTSFATSNQDCFTEAGVVALTGTGLYSSDFYSICATVGTTDKSQDFVHLYRSTNSVTTEVDFPTVGLASRPWYDIYGSVFFVGVHQSTDQSTFFVMNYELSVHTIGKFLIATAGDINSKPYVSSLCGTRGAFGSLSGTLELALVKKNKLISTGGKISTVSGISVVSIAQNTVPTAASLSSSMNFSGGFMRSWDGQTVTESGFNLYPESISGITTATGNPFGQYNNTALEAISGVTAAELTSAGLLAVGNHFYKVTALNGYGETAASTEVSVSCTRALSAVRISWTSVANATGYRVFGSTTTGAETLLAYVDNLDDAVTFYDDYGMNAFSVVTPPATDTTVATYTLPLTTPTASLVATYAPVDVLPINSITRSRPWVYAGYAGNWSSGLMFECGNFGHSDGFEYAPINSTKLDGSGAWVCTVAGAPGTWVLEHNASNKITAGWNYWYSVRAVFTTAQGTRYGPMNPAIHGLSPGYDSFPVVVFSPVFGATSYEIWRGTSASTLQYLTASDSYPVTTNSWRIFVDDSTNTPNPAITRSELGLGNHTYYYRISPTDRINTGSRQEMIDGLASANMSRALVAPAWLALTRYEFADTVTSDGKAWFCIAAGTTGAAGNNPVGAVGSKYVDPAGTLHVRWWCVGTTSLDRVYVTWNNATNAAGTVPYAYKVWQSIDGGTYYLVSTVMPGGGGYTTWEDDGEYTASTTVTPPIASTTADAGALEGGSMLASKLLWYRVSAVTKYGKETLCSAEVNLALNYTGGIVITWPQVQGAVGYYVYKGLSSGTETLLMDSTILRGTKTFFVDQGLSYDQMNASITPPLVDHTNETTVTYQYAATYEWTDAVGIVHYSAPSDQLVAYLVDGITAATTTTITIPTLQLTEKANVQVTLYRTLLNVLTGNPVFYRVGSAANSTAATVSIIDNIPDATLDGNAYLYTTGGVLDNIPPPACILATLHRGRIFAVDSMSRNKIWYSKKHIDGYPVEYAYEQQIIVDEVGGDISALASIDSHLIIFKKNSIWYTGSEGLGPTGLTGDNYTDLTLLPGDIGCIDSGSVVSTLQGVFFRSAKGIYLFDRSLNLQYVGADIEPLLVGQSVASAQVIAAKHQVRFLLANTAIVLVYDWLVGQWAQWNLPHAVLISSVINEKYTALGTDSKLYQETAATYADDGAWIPLTVKTAWIRPDGISKWNRTRNISLLGTKSTNDFTINVTIRNAFQDTDPYQQVSSIATSDWAETAGPISPMIKLTDQKSPSVQLEISDAAIVGQTIDAGLTLSGLSFEVGTLRGMRKLPAIKKY
jgi:hypothetical protein